MVLGSAMLGMKRARQGQKVGRDRKRGCGISRFVLSSFLNLLSVNFIFQVEMTPVGTLIPLKATNKGKKLLESKYGISWKLLRSRRGGGKRWKMLQMKSSPNMTNNVNSIYP